METLLTRSSLAALMAFSKWALFNVGGAIRILGCSSHSSLLLSTPMHAHTHTHEPHAHTHARTHAHTRTHTHTQTHTVDGYVGQRAPVLPYHQISPTLRSTPCSWSSLTGIPHMEYTYTKPRAHTILNHTHAIHSKSQIFSHCSRIGSRTSSCHFSTTFVVKIHGITMGTASTVACLIVRITHTPHTHTPHTHHTHTHHTHMHTHTHHTHHTHTHHTHTTHTYTHTHTLPM